MLNEPFFVARLPLGPTTNQSYKTVNFKTKKGNVVRRPGATPALLQFKKDAAKLLAAQRSQQNWATIHDIRARWLKGEHTHLTVTLMCHLEHMWASDNDGRLKGAQDAAFKFMDINDNMAVKTIIEKCLAEGEPFCEITVAIKDDFVYGEKPKKRATRAKVAKKESNATDVYLKKMRARGNALAKTVKYPAR
jgi:hypothetical protein